MSTSAVNPSMAAMPQMFPSELPVYICSVYPGRLYHRMPVRSRLDKPRVDENGVTHYFTNISEYALGPVPKGSHQTLAVWPTLEAVSVFLPDGDQGELKPTRTGAPSSAEIVAKSLIEVWRGTLHVGTGTHIGVGMIAGPEPTPEELAYLRETQTRHFHIKVDIGNQMWAGKTPHELKALQHPNSEYRMAAEYLGIETEWNRNWIAEGTISTKTCIGCGEPIQPLALVCKHCQKDLITFAQQRGWDAEKVRVKGDAAVAAELEDIEKAAIKKQTAAVAKPAAPKPAPIVAAPETEAPEAPKTLGQIAKEKTGK